MCRREDISIFLYIYIYIYIHVLITQLMNAKYSWWRHQMETSSALLALFVRGIHWSPVNSPHKAQWRGALMISLVCTWINGGVNNRDTGDFRCHGAHYDVIKLFNYRRISTYRGKCFHLMTSSCKCWTARLSWQHYVWSWPSGLCHQVIFTHDDGHIQYSVYLLPANGTDYIHEILCRHEDISRRDDIGLYQQFS